MARTGLLKSEVKKARESLLAQQINPSVDAVRIALGNTGSKTTIHKYLKELDEEIGGPRPSISEVLQDMVSRLAGQLQADADLRIDEIRLQSNEKERAHFVAVSELQATIGALSSQVMQLEDNLTQERTSHIALQGLLQQETLVRHTAEQQVVNLKERLAENESHRQSLEEKHLHARDALEHYRQSAKEQRDQDLRRQEQQIQELQAEMRKLQQTIIIKQEEVTRLNREGASLVADLSHARQALYDEQGKNRIASEKLEAMKALEERNETLLNEVKKNCDIISELQIALTENQQQIEALTKNNHTLELTAVTAQAKLSAHEHIVDDLRNAIQSKGRELSPQSFEESKNIV